MRNRLRTQGREQRRRPSRFAPTLERLEARHLLAADPVITEIMADPDSDWDGDGLYDFRDDEWVEIFNEGPGAVDLGNLLLGDSAGLLTYGFTGLLGEGEALVVYGSDSLVGLVQLFFGDLVKEIQVACPPDEDRKPVLAADFERELNQSLESLFGR